MVTKHEKIMAGLMVKTNLYTSFGLFWENRWSELLIIRFWNTFCNVRKTASWSAGYCLSQTDGKGRLETMYVRDVCNFRTLIMIWTDTVLFWPIKQLHTTFNLQIKIISSIDGFWSCAIIWGLMNRPNTLCHGWGFRSPRQRVCSRLK